MTIEIHQPKIQALIEQRMATGAFESIEDLLLQSLQASPAVSSPEQEERLQAADEKQNFADFLLNSPLHGSGLVVERIKDVSSPQSAQPDSAQRTGRALIDAMQSMPYKDIDIEPLRPHMPVRDVVF